MSKGPKVGADEWVARQAHRREYLPSWLGRAQRQAERIGWWPRLALAGLAAAALPLFGLGGVPLPDGDRPPEIPRAPVGPKNQVGLSRPVHPRASPVFCCGPSRVPRC